MSNRELIEKRTCSPVGCSGSRFKAGTRRHLLPPGAGAVSDGRVGRTNRRPASGGILPSSVERQTTDKQDFIKVIFKIKYCVRII